MITLASFSRNWTTWESPITPLSSIPPTMAPNPGPGRKFAADQMWLFIPLQSAIREFVTTIPEYPFQMGSSLSAAGIDYDLFRRAGALKQLEGVKQRLDTLGPGAGDR